MAQQSEVEIRLGVLDTIHRYAIAFDAADIEHTVASLFAREGRFVMGTGNPFPKSALKDVFAPIQTAIVQAAMRHHVTTTKINLGTVAENQQVHAETYFLLFSKDGLDGWGKWLDVLVHEEGGWKFLEKRVLVESSIPNSHFKK